MDNGQWTMDNGLTRWLVVVLMCLAGAVSAQMVPVDTAILVTVGPLIDATDFKSLETAVAYNATGMSVDLIESSVTGAGAKTDITLTTGSTQDWTHLGNGIYEIEITAAQNDTEGSLQVVGVCDGVLPFFSPVYTVVPTAVYASLVTATDYLQTDAVQIEGSDATNAINAEADTALSDYDPPTNAEMVARTLVAASYFDPAADTVANVTTVATLTGHTPQTADHAASIAAILADTAAVDTASELQTLLMGSAVAPASTTQAATAQADLDILTGTDGVTLATSQPNYAPATAAALSTAQGDITAILTDTAAVDTASELQTLLMGSAVAPASSTALATAQSDLDTLTGADGVTLATSQPNYAPSTAAAVAALNNLSAAQVNAEVDTALTDIHLDHLLAADYDPASKPGVSTALLNELIENDGGVSRYTANALEQAPGGGSGGDATAANQVLILAALDDVQGATFDTATDSLEAIRNQGDAAWGGGGSGDTPVNEDTGGTDALAYKTSGGSGIQGATIKAYLTSEYNAGVYTVRGQTTTLSDGGWAAPMMLEADTSYTLVYYKAGAYGPDIQLVTP